jgi:phosphoglycerol transferase
MLNLATVLLGTIGGFGSLFAWTISSYIRAYNRISIYIGFFSLFAVALLVDRRRQWWKTTFLRTVTWYAGVLWLPVFGLWEQTTSRLIPPYAEQQMEYRSDADFIHRIEATAPKQAMIFQLPYVPFPEQSPVYRMIDYDHLRGYLHSQDLRWSYGTMKGREGAAWQQQVVQQPLDQMITTLKEAGFSGLYVDCYGYADEGANIVGQLRSLIPIAPIVSANGRLYFFSLLEDRAP